MIRVMKRSGDEYKADYFSRHELRKWLSQHTQKDGEVVGDLVVFGEVAIKSDEDGYQWTMSDFTLDRDMERIDPAGWDLKSFKDNPIVLWSHDTSIPAIGRMDNVRRADGAIVGKVLFDDDDPFAAMIHGKVKKGILTKGSVGFKPTKIEWIEDEKDLTKLIYRKQELYEFSIVNVPSNVNASRRGVDIPEEIEETMYEESAGDCRETSGDPDRDTSDLKYLFDESDEKTTLEDIIHGYQDQR